MTQGERRGESAAGQMVSVGDERIRLTLAYSERTRQCRQIRLIDIYGRRN